MLFHFQFSFQVLDLSSELCRFLVSSLLLSFGHSQLSFQTRDLMLKLPDFDLQFRDTSLLPVQVLTESITFPFNPDALTSDSLKFRTCAFSVFLSFPPSVTFLSNAALTVLQFLEYMVYFLLENL